MWVEGQLPRLPQLTRKRPVGAPLAPGRAGRGRSRRATAGVVLVLGRARRARARRGREAGLTLLPERLDDAALGDQRDEAHHRAQQETLEPARDPHRPSVCDGGGGGAACGTAPPLRGAIRTAAPRARSAATPYAPGRSPRGRRRSSPPPRRRRAMRLEPRR